MVMYNPRNWLSLIFHAYSRRVMSTLFPAIIFMVVYSAVLCYIMLDKLKLHEADFQPTIAMHSLLGIVLGLFLVFRTNTAYDRWWEGRRLWGAFVNNSRNLILKWSVYLPLHETTRRRELRNLVINYVYCTKNHLRGNGMFEEKEWIPVNCLSLDEIKAAQHKPNRIAAEMYRLVNTLYTSGTLTPEQFRNLDSELTSFTDICGGCERIKRTPIPYSYSLFLKKIIFLYTITLPFAFCNDFGYATVPIAMAVLYVFSSIELIAEEIEDPFGDDDNDLPTDDICKRIKSNLEELIP